MSTISESAYFKMQDNIDRLTAKVAELQKYVQHTADCASVCRGSDCTCGLEEILAARKL
jgi:hypothetical protein